MFGFSESIGVTKIVGINAGHIASQGVSGGSFGALWRSSALIELLEQLNEPWVRPEQVRNPRWGRQ